MSKLTAETKDYWNNNYGPNVNTFLAEVLGQTVHVHNIFFKANPSRHNTGVK